MLKSYDFKNIEDSNIYNAENYMQFIIAWLRINGEYFVFSNYLKT